MIIKQASLWVGGWSKICSLLDTAIGVAVIDGRGIGIGE